MKNKIIHLLLLTLLISCVSATTLFSQTKSLYNLGESINVVAKVKPSSDINGFLELGLDCGELKEFYKQYLSLSVGEEKEISTNLPLNNFFVSDAGTCKIVSIFGSETSYSQEFEVSDEIDVIASIDNSNPLPGSEITISGTAVRANGENAEGFVDVAIKNTNIKVSSVINNGKFSIKLKIPENQKAGLYYVKVYAYEKIDDEVSNNGKSETLINVKSMPKSIEIALSSTEITPGKGVKYSPIILDQAGEKISNKEVRIIIYALNGKVFAEKVSMSGNEEELVFETSTLPGIWKIEASSSGLKNQKEIKILEFENAEISLENNTLVITNTGNIPYKKDIEVTIGGDTRILSVEVPIKSTKKYKIYAPEGLYNLRASDGVNEIKANDVLLTGRAVKIIDVSESIPFVKAAIIWLFIFVILGLFIYNKYSGILPRTRKYEVSEDSITEQKPISLEIRKEIENRKYSEIALPDSVTPKIAEHAIVLNGIKQYSSLVALNIKNSGKIGSFKEILNEVAGTIVENKGAIYQSGNFLIAILAPISTRTFKNEVLAVKLAGEIDSKLKAYNQKAREKIDYGIIVHSDELVVSKTKDVLKFTTTGNALTVSKKLSDLADNEYLISENAYQKAMSDIKANKEIRNGVNLYKVSKIIDKEAADKFIHDFLNRQKQK